MNNILGSGHNLRMGGGACLNGGGAKDFSARKLKWGKISMHSLRGGGGQNFSARKLVLAIIFTGEN